MAKELPYFKFHVSEWSDGDITLEDYEVQGFFISLCAYYWSNKCVVQYKKARKKFKGTPEDLWETLLDNDIVKLKEDDTLTISFLNEQWEERGGLCSQNSENAKNGWKKRKAEAEAKRLQNETDATALNPQSETDAESMQYREEKKREEKKREEHVDYVYSLYPTRCFIKNTSTGKCSKNKEQIKKLLKEHSLEHLVGVIKFYLGDCKKGKVFIKNFGTFLNNLPDIEEQKPVVNKNLITYRWSDDQIKRTIEKDKAESYFANMEQGGYKAIILD